MKGVSITVKLPVLLTWIAMLAIGQEANRWILAVPITWGPQEHGWQFAIFTEKQSYFAGEPIPIMLVARNEMGKNMRVVKPRTAYWDMADFTIKRVGGDKVPIRPPQDPVDNMKRHVGSYSEVQVEAGGLLRIGPTDLQMMYDLPPGTYTVEAQRLFPYSRAEFKPPVRSNSITIQVVAR